MSRHSKEARHHQPGGKGLEATQRSGKKAEQEDLEAKVWEALASTPEETKTGGLSNLVTVWLHPWPTLGYERMDLTNVTVMIIIWICPEVHTFCLFRQFEPDHDLQ